eukprot:TRINITY_DN47954_c0_g1_i1.p1 TRINITY_DN47954_c0_g1~~TRINITY_DN47954_c0_g1_i1.p1  ORF type:complete len:236 (-),score=50.02 TRINITY_DN47954_c0_g1_i1:581-1246(-)
MGPPPLGNDYARHYARILGAFMPPTPAFHLAEIGILAGLGLAIWAELLPQAVLHGFDADLSSASSSLEELRTHGAFLSGPPQLHLLDARSATAERVGEALRGQKLKLVIDDGEHSDETILLALLAFRPHVTEDCVYVVEDATESTARILQAWLSESLVEFHPGAKFEKGLAIVWNLYQSNSIELPSEYLIQTSRAHFSRHPPPKKEKRQLATSGMRTLQHV